MQPRVDLYTTIHKALRASLYDLGVELGRSDFKQPNELAVALATYRRTVAFLREHHGHEDTFVEPALAPLDPEIRKTVAAHHDASDAWLAELDALAAEPGPALVARYQKFLIEYLAHMDYEESVVAPALWAQYSDPELMAIRAKVQASIPLPRFCEWLEIILPALNLDERTGMLGGVKANAPAPVFEQVSAVAARVLGQTGWAALRARVGA